MEKNENKILTFIKQRIFYNVDKEEKQYVRTTIMNDDHKSFRILLITVFVLQIIMIMYKLITSGNGLSNKDLYYIICYSVLAGCCLIAFFVSESFHSNQKPSQYFTVIAAMVNILFLWALAIACIDSFRGTDLTTFAYATVAIAAIVILDPWIFILDSIIFSTGLCLCIGLIPELKFYPSVVISAVSIALLISIIGVLNFKRRINSILLQKEVSELNGELSSQSHVDALTNIYNRRYLTEHINDALNLGITPSGVIMFDIDDFKKINDEYGHQVGDDCLVALGKMANEFISQHKNSYAVRYGGEEFLIFISRTDRMKLLTDAEEFRKQVEQTKIQTSEGMEINITISLGIALAKTGQNYSGLINKSDACLYTAKRKGKNRVAVEE